LLLAITSSSAYLNSLSAPFIFDDLPAIVENTTIRDWRNWAEVLSPPAQGSGVTGRPMVNLSLALNYAVGELNPLGYHVTNLLLHVVCVYFLWGILRRTFVTAPFAINSGFTRDSAESTATLGAALWSLHPLQTESVTCVIQRTELLVGVFYLGTLYFAIRATGSRRNPLWSIGAAVSCALGMASKEVMVSAPIVVLLYDRLINGIPFAAALKSRRGLYMALAAGCVVLGVLVLGMGGSRGEAAGFGTGGPWWAYSLKQCEAILLYLGLTAWPHPLVLFYGVDLVYAVSEVALQLSAIVVAIALTAWGLHRGHPLAFPSLWFFALLAPSSSVIPLVSQTVSEHRMYLPLAGPLMVAVFFGHLVLGRKLFLCGALIAVAFGLLVAARNRDYASELSIWNDTVAKAPQNARARVNFGAALKAAGKIEAAQHHYEMAAALDPTSAEARNNLATLLIESGRWTEAIPHLENALALRPKLAEVHINLASALLHRNDPGRALRHAREAVRLKPGAALAYSNLGYAELRSGDTPAAIAAFERAIALDAGLGDARSTLGGLLYQAGRFAEAAGHFEATLKAGPESVVNLNNLASAYAQLGRLPDAIALYRAALQVDPAFLDSHWNLALILARSGAWQDALVALDTMARVKPDDLRIAPLRAQIVATEQAHTPATPTPRN
jgi:tetratricopeptide (TPR) repeat protein